MAIKIVFATVLACASGIRRKSRAANAATACGIKGEASSSLLQIVNGDDATPCEWPWQVSFTRPARNIDLGQKVLTYCGGTLISPEWVLTAADCVTRGISGVEILLGSHHQWEVDSNQQNIAAAEAYVHPSHNKWNYTYDIALVRLETPAKITSCVRPACLPVGGDVEPNMKCWITGWGELKTDGVSPNILQEAEVKIWSNKDCTGFLNYEADQIDDTMVCAQGGNLFGGIRDACYGDNGGPLVCKGEGGWTVYGATSWAARHECAGRTKPGIWSRVHKSLAWIESTMSNAPAQAPKVARCNDGGGRTVHSLPDYMGECRCAHRKGYTSCLEVCAPPPAGKTCGSKSGSRYYKVGCAACKCYSAEEVEACNVTGASE